jgi:hypothetical protein
VLTSNPAAFSVSVALPSSNPITLGTSTGLMPFETRSVISEPFAMIAGHDYQRRAGAGSRRGGGEQRLEY